MPSTTPLSPQLGERADPRSHPQVSQSTGVVRRPLGEGRRSEEAPVLGGAESEAFGEPPPEEVRVGQRIAGPDAEQADGRVVKQDAAFGDLGGEVQGATFLGGREDLQSVWAHSSACASRAEQITERKALHSAICSGHRSRSAPMSDERTSRRISGIPVAAHDRLAAGGIGGRSVLCPAGEAWSGPPQRTVPIGVIRSFVRRRAGRRSGCGRLVDGRAVGGRSRVPCGRRLVWRPGQAGLSAVTTMRRAGVRALTPGFWELQVVAFLAQPGGSLQPRCADGEAALRTPARLCQLTSADPRPRDRLRHHRPGQPPGHSRAHREDREITVGDRKPAPLRTRHPLS
ncbi:hypothetical protein SAMN05216499_109208 [Actinacidiphila paucisporea]|uniref:Uncharacterized protein n=1 Tax=Actinacidiphila paucisporea TaxID=310782 RepID=A0A1M7H9T1_9ACTN|nr:hypothetical protein SAMN05216499_109208 [Actinacidiphila paucisporea]